MGGTIMIGTVIARYLTKKAFDHLNNKDIEAFLSIAADDVVMHFPGDLPISGQYRGKQAIREWLGKLFGLFSEYRFTVKNIYMKDICAFGPSNSAAVEFDLEGKLKSGTPYKNSYVLLIHIKGGKVVRSQEFPYDFEKVKAAWEE